MNSCWLYEVKWPEVEEYLQEDDLILIPVGSTEQHGPHLPMGTDALVAIHLAEDAAKETGTLVAPPLWYGWSTHHMGYPGSTTLAPETVTQVVVEVCMSLVHHGFKKLVIINGHAQANLPPLHIAAVKVKNYTGALVAVVDPWDLGDTIARELLPDEPGSMGHASQLEGSQMLYLHPELVDKSKATRNVLPQRRFSYSDHYVQGDRVYTAKSPEEFKQLTAPSGVYGDATTIAAEIGEEYHKALVASLVEFIGALKDQGVEITPAEIPA
jgi:creatinine amidohydrolase